MRFASPWLLLALVPALVVAVYGIRRLLVRPAALNFPTLTWVRRGRPPLWGRLHWVPRLLQTLAVVLAVVALARPQVEETEVITGEGADFVVAVDMSGSMNAVDMSPEDIMTYHSRGREPPNRFESARQTIREFILSRDQDRIGLVIFSSRAWVKFPLTLDRDAMVGILDSLVLDDGLRGPSGTCGNGCTITGEATAIGDALGRAYKRVEGSESKSRNIILITDGDNNAGRAAPEEVARFITEDSAASAVRVFTFLVGTGTDTFMPARNPFTGQPMKTVDGLTAYERPKEKFPVNPELLAQIAELTGGSFHEAATEEDFRKEFQDLEKTEFKSLALSRYREAFVFPLALALGLFLLGELLVVTLFRRWP